MKILLGLFPILFFAFQLAAQSGTITTNMLNKQTNSPNPNYKVSLYQGDEFKGSTTANEQGVAVLDNITLTDVVYTQRINNFAISNVTPDEQTHRPSVFINSPKYTNVNYTIYTLPLAKQLSKGTIHLEYGHNQVLFPEMGADGRRLIVFNGKDFAKAFKYISTNHVPINARTVSNPTNGALSKLNSVDEDVRLVFEDDGYVTYDTTLTLPTGETFNVNIDGSMERIPQETNADITTMSIIGENLPGFPVHFVVGGKDSVYTSDANGLIPFKFKDFNDPYIDSMMVYIDDPEDESENDQWMGDIIVKENSPNANMGAGEIAQNVAINRSEHEDFYLQLNQLNDVYNIAMKFTPRFGELGDGSIGDLKSTDVAIMANRIYTVPDFAHCRWLNYELNTGEVMDSVYIFIQTNHKESGEPVANILMDRVVDQMNLIRGIYQNQPNGLNTLKISKSKFIKNEEDPTYLDHVNNKQLQNMILIQFSYGNPGNFLTKREDGTNALHYGIVSLTESSTPGTVLSEIIAAIGGYKDANGVNVGSRFTVPPDLNKISKFGKILANFTAEYKQGRVMLKR